MPAVFCDGDPAGSQVVVVVAAGYTHMYIYIYTHIHHSHIHTHTLTYIYIYMVTPDPHDPPQPSCQYSCAVFCPKMLSPRVRIYRYLRCVLHFMYMST